MIIKNITLKTKNNPNIFILSTDKKDYILHSDVIVKHGIKVGNIDVDKLNDCERESEIIIAFNQAIKYITNKVKTEQQIKDYLYKQKFNSVVVKDVCVKLKDYGVIDDKNFAKSYISTNKNFSKIKLKQKLFSFGINKELIEEILSDLDDYDGCLVNAKKFFKNKDYSKANIEKLTRRLFNLGYSYETIKTVLNELKIDLGEDL